MRYSTSRRPILTVTESSHECDVPQLARSRSTRSQSTFESTQTIHSLLHLLAHLHRLVDVLFVQVNLAEVDRVCSKCLRMREELWNGREVVVGREVPEECRRDAYQRATRSLDLAPLHCLNRVQPALTRRTATERAYLYCCFVNHDFVVTGPDEAAAEVLELLAGLDKQVAAGWGELHGNTLARVPCPNVETRIA